MSTLLCVKWHRDPEHSAAWSGRHLSYHTTKVSSLGSGFGKGRNGAHQSITSASIHSADHLQVRLLIHCPAVPLSVYPPIHPLHIQSQSICPSIPLSIHPLHCCVPGVEPDPGHTAGAKGRTWHGCLPDFFFPIGSLGRRQGLERAGQPLLWTELRSH